MSTDNLKTKEVAELLSISESTVKRYADIGLLEYIRIGNYGHRRYPKESVEKYLLNQNNQASEILDNKLEKSNKKIGKLVANPHPGHYLMHKYWGRKAHNIVQQYIKHFTNPGDKVLDPFMGSGVTVIESIKSNRTGIGVDLNPMSIAIVENTIRNVDLQEFEATYSAIVGRVEKAYAHLYHTECTVCGKTSKIDCCVWDNDTLVSVRGICQDHGTFIKKATENDVETYQLASATLHSLSPDQKNTIPIDEIPRYVKRNNKETIDQLFSDRALVNLSALKAEINKVEQEGIRKLLEFVFTSCLANTSRMLPGDTKKATYRSGWVISKFWVPPVHAERNAISCFKLRFNAILKGKKEVIELHNGNSIIHHADSTKLPLDDNSINYIFTDPPYGESIAYFSLSHLWNTWLKNEPEFKNEIIIDSYRNKDYTDYANRIQKAYSEMFRVLKPGGYMSFTFHNRDLNVWKAIIDACVLSGFEFISAILQEQAVSSGTQGINKNNTLTGDFVYTFRKPEQTNTLSTKVDYHKDGERLIINEVHSFLKKHWVSNSSDLYEFIIPVILNNRAVLDKKGKVINLEKLLLTNFDYRLHNGTYKWQLKQREGNKNEFTVLDLFAGAGGMSSGFEKAGFKVVAAIEHDPKISDTYLHNHQSTVLIVDDIRKVSAKHDLENAEHEIIEHFKTGTCTVIIGGPPCQGFSMAGNRIRKEKNFFEDKRNFLFREYYRMVKALTPDFFVLENVPGILTYNNGKIEEEIKEKFEDLGYQIHSEVLVAADYGVPQLRKRAVFIGNKLGIDPKLLFPEKTHTSKNYVTVWDAIGDLPNVKTGQSFEPFKDADYNEMNSPYQKLMRSKSGEIFNHVSSKQSPKTIEILSQIKEGQGMKDIPKEYHTKSVHSGAYGRMEKVKPAYTLTTRLNTPSVGRITHPIEHRTITPREAARIQSFDDSYRFFGDITSLGIQIGNAVPPLLAKAIADKILSILTEKKAYNNV
jgi:DNA-cytosine methyltransferase